MSTAFQIYPHSNTLPTFKQVADNAAAEFKIYLEEIDVQTSPVLVFNIKCIDTHLPRRFDYDEPFQWGEHEYLWIQIEGIAGGTDVEFSHIHEIWRGLLRDEFASLIDDASFGSYASECLATGYRWSFRRSAGQPGSIVILYGLVAGCVANLTKGVVFSGDGAWDYKQMPMTGTDLLCTYMRPDRTKKADLRDWAQRCIEGARRDFAEHE